MAQYPRAPPTQKICASSADCHGNKTLPGCQPQSHPGQQGYGSDPHALVKHGGCLSSPPSQAESVSIYPNSPPACPDTHAALAIQQKDMREYPGDTVSMPYYPGGTECPSTHAAVCRPHSASPDDSNESVSWYPVSHVGPTPKPFTLAGTQAAQVDSLELTAGCPAPACVTDLLPPPGCSRFSTGGRVKTAPHGDPKPCPYLEAQLAAAVTCAPAPSRVQATWSDLPQPSRKNFYADDECPPCCVPYSPMHPEPPPSISGGSDVNPCCELYCPKPKQGCCPQAHAPPRPCANGACKGE